MKSQTAQQSIKSIYQMLFEMATGNFSFRLKPTFNNDGLDKLVLVLNCIAQEMKTTIIEAGYVTPHFHYQNLVQHLIVLDSQFVIKGFNLESAKLFQRPESIEKVNFRDILTPQSQKIWDNLIAEKEDAAYYSTVQLTLVTTSKEVLPLVCTVSRLTFNNLIIISSVTTILQDLLLDKPSSATLKKPDANLAQQLHDYIVNSLEEPFPSIQELAILFNTNEFNLKESFRHFYKTSIYHFYIEERMKKCLQLIMQTNIPLKEIAYISGFNSYDVFSRAFRKKFGYAPRDVKRNE